MNNKQICRDKQRTCYIHRSEGAQMILILLNDICQV